ncbi:alpha/beta hydrolase [Ruficoccus sp. ZRK36]|uniref:alpha/beta hydrolase n=1 Tax=Ruficoccus sp. ZRK36 TaxID=2866311 RepID=UPI001C72AAB5|nr:alpha/beta hydrolase [Ruficoccus sp. ZRK36]QYY34951.1 alpha/beta hydrolase [Ruficoccus sp. ZRK36]
MKSRIAPLLLGLCALSLVQPLNAFMQSSTVALSSDEVTVIKDIDYLGADRKEKMDAYLPAASFERPLPAVLLIHGGGWRVGDKAAKRERSIANDLTAHGYAVFSINYELNVGERDPKTKKLTLSHLAWPQNLYDCKSAVRFLRLKADEYGINPEQIAVTGGSAGGHLSMMVGATANDDEINQHGLYLNQSNAISCILNFYGIYDVRKFHTNPFSGAPREVRTAHADAASPDTYFDKDLPPMFIAHGTADKTIPVKYSRELAQALAKLGTPYVYIEIEGAPHSFDLQPEQFDLRPTVLSFLQQYLGTPQKAQ